MATKFHGVSSMNTCGLLACGILDGHKVPWCEFYEYTSLACMWYIRLGHKVPWCEFYEYTSLACMWYIRLGHKVPWWEFYEYTLVASLHNIPWLLGNIHDVYLVQLQRKVCYKEMDVVMADCLWTWESTWGDWWWGVSGLLDLWPRQGTH